ncbi:MAG TPA: cobalamin-binding protein [Candidatus Acidoferrales bacterium]|nr:cobalamin-binding protein [Candidatus Acidoferrales bacterium]
MRILSLLPSATEIVYALGLGDELVGVSHECDYPDEARTKPIVSTSHLSTTLRSEEIHSVVSEHQHSSHSLYEIDDELLKQIDPDVILTQELCTVCAIPVAQVRDAARILNGTRCIVSLEPTNLGQILENISAVAEVTDRQAEAQALVQSLERRIQRVATATSAVTTRPRVFCMEWMEPLLAAGHWIPEMVRLAGGTDCFGHQGRHSAPVPWTQLIDAAPELIVIMPCGYKIGRTLGEVDRLASMAHWIDLPAVREGHVYVVDSPAYFSRPGPRVVTGLEILAHIIQPKLFSGLIPVDSAVKLDWDKSHALDSQRMSERFAPLT